MTGNFILVFGLIICSIFYLNMTGKRIYVLSWGGLLGGAVGFSYPLIYKGITGYTPLEKRELFQNKG